MSIIIGDMRTVLAGMADASVDAIVTDPPYGLSKEPDAEEVLRHWLAGDEYANGGGFMGKTWDSFVPGPAMWREVYRVLKPGGHLVAFFGSRTYDLGVMAIRLAGFECRDQLAYMFGSGFPKSLDVSKAIDKSAGAEREVVGKKGGRYASPKQDFRGGKHHAANGVSNAMFDEITAPATPEAVKWQGWGTALKPAHEPIVLARKPLVGTVAANVLKYGCGGINVDGCRIATDWVAERGETWLRSGKQANADEAWQGPGTKSAGSTVADRVSPLGRWPANVILDEEAARLLDEQSGYSRSPAGTVTQGGSRSYDPGGGRSKRSGAFQGHGDSGGASRFFYTAKASRAERERGLVAVDGGRANTHPTVKPISVMRWLVRLVCPPGGLVLDPFAGSGTTGIACALEGMAFIGVELSPEYAEIARLRIAANAATDEEAA